MLALIVNASQNALQILALAAAIVFGLATLASLRPPIVHVQTLVAAGLTLLALAIMWL